MTDISLSGSRSGTFGVEDLVYVVLLVAMIVGSVGGLAVLFTGGPRWVAMTGLSVTLLASVGACVTVGWFRRAEERRLLAAGRRLLEALS